MEIISMTNRVIIYKTLSSSSIDWISQQLDSFMDENCSMDRRDKLRVRLSVEEALLDWQEALGQCELRLTLYHHFGKPCIKLAAVGREVNPYENGTGGSGLLSASNLLSVFGIEPGYSYANGINYINIKLPGKEHSSVFNLLLAFGIAVILGFLSGFLPEQVTMLVSASLVEPLMDSFTGFISAVAGPMIFISVLWSVFAIGDISTLSNVGGKLIGRCLGMNLLIALVTLASLFGFFDLSFAGNVDLGADVKGVLGLILDIVPENFFTPILEGNTLQLVFLAFALGIAMLTLGEKIHTVAEFVEQANYVMQVVLSGVSKLLPAFVFLCTLNLFIGNKVYAAGNSLMVITAFIALLALLQLLGTFYVSRKNGMSVRQLFKKQLPAVLIAFTTVSSTATYNVSSDICKNKLGIAPQFVDFALPVCQVFMKGGSTMLFLTVSLIMAEIFKVPIGPDWMVIMVFMSILMSVVCLPIPGASASCFAILFAQLGIPETAMVLSIALNTLLGFFYTQFTVAFQQLVLIQTAERLGYLDTEELRR